MNLITLDMETYYGDDYTLSKLTTEAYVRDPRFEAIMVGIKVNDEKSYTVVGGDIAAELHRCDVSSSAVLCHHAHFDGLILAHHYRLKPKIWFDTLSMGRAEIGSVIARGMSLGSMAEHLGLGKKGHEVVPAKGKHLADFSRDELEDYRRYCCNDVDLTYAIYQKLISSFSVSELKLIDLTTRLFTEPILELDTELLEEYKDLVLRNKEYLMLRAGVTREELTSNNKFADVLRRFGVEPPMKDSPTVKMPDGTPKRTYAFAKTDEGMKALVESEDENIQMIAEARLGVKTSIAETRAQRFIDMSGNGPACVYLKYWGAEQTGRHAGGDKMNWQNLGRIASLEEHHRTAGLSLFTSKGRAEILDPGVFGLTGISTSLGMYPEYKCHRIGLRDAVKAPEGYALVVGDSANIEARMVCWVAGQEDILDKYQAGEDLYCDMASMIFGHDVSKKDKDERQLGKVAVLGLGFGMGKAKFYETARKPPWNIQIEEATAGLAVSVFRDRYYKVAAFWKYLNDVVIPAMADGGMRYADPRQKIMTGPRQLILSNGRVLRYPNLRQRKNPDPDSPFKVEWVFDVREGARVIPTRLYGGKLCIAEGTKVLTNLGWVNIEDITVQHLVHDGVDFISHGGVIYKSVQECVEVDGVLMTPEHEVLTNEGWKAALEKPKPYRPDLRHVNSLKDIQERRKKDVVGIPVPMRVGMYQSGYGSNQGNKAGWNPKLRMRDQTAKERKNNSARNVPSSGILRMAKYGRQRFATLTSSVETLWRAGNHSLCGVANTLRDFLEGHGGCISARSLLRTARQHERILKEQLLLGDIQTTEPESTKLSGSGHTRSGSGDRDRKINAVLSAETRSTACPVYDILNCGPRQRFVVQGFKAPFIVHNCENIVQALARIIVMDQAVVISRRYKVVMLVHDEVVCCVPEDQAEECKQFMLEVMSTTPEWAEGLPIAAEVGVNRIYSLAK